MTVFRRYGRLLVIGCWIASPAWGALHEVIPNATETAAPSRPGTTAARWHERDVEGLIGPSVFNGNVGVALAIRGRIVRDWFTEVGGIIPHAADHCADDRASTTQGTQTTNLSSHVESYAETHWSALYRFYRWETDSRRRFSLYGGAGLSVAFVRNRMESVTTDGAGVVIDARTRRPVRTRLGPRIQLGAEGEVRPHLVLSLNLAWVHYANEDGLSGLSQDLDFGGLLIQPMLHWRF